MLSLFFVSANIFLLAALAITATSGASRWFAKATALWLTMAAAYAGATMAASVVVAWRHGWAILPYLPPVFAAYHLSYGLGSLAGLRWLLLKPGPAISWDSVYVWVTR